MSLEALADCVAREMIIEAAFAGVGDKITELSSAEVRRVLRRPALEHGGRESLDLGPEDAAWLAKTFPASFLKSERAIRRAVMSVWHEERAATLANLRKGLGPLAGRRKFDEDLLDDILPPAEKWAVKLLNRLTPALKQAVRDAGKASFARYGFSGIFNMQSPFVEQWLWKYVPKLAGEISEEDRRRIMDALREGILMGEGVDDLARRLGDVMDDWDRYRSRLVGRTEAIRASNKGALESYRQSGVVEAKQWSANPTACEICLELDGKIIELDESYIGLGEAMPITERINDYADIEGPPAHPACLCVLLPVIVGLEGGGAEEE